MGFQPEIDDYCMEQFSNTDGLKGIIVGRKKGDKDLK